MKKLNEITIKKDIQLIEKDLEVLEFLIKSLENSCKFQVKIENQKARIFLEAISKNVFQELSKNSCRYFIFKNRNTVIELENYINNNFLKLKFENQVISELLEFANLFAIDILENQDTLNKLIEFLKD